MRSRSVLIVVALVVGACGGGADAQAPNATVGPGADSAQEAVRLLVDHLNEPDFSAAADLAVPNHAALASLAEGATFGEVADALRSGDATVAANFWAGFAQGTGSYLTGPITTGEGPSITRDELEFETVVITPESGDDRVMMVRDVDGHRIDLFASFGPGLADKMIPPVERLLSTQTDDAWVIISELKTIVPSLRVAGNQPGLSPVVSQQLIQLIELITRVS
jgi:hypothetical protein